MRTTPLLLGRLAGCALSLLAGCALAPDATRVAALNSTIGQSQADLVRGLGPPLRTAQSGATTRLLYVRTGAVTNPLRPDPNTVPVVDAVGAAFDYPPEATAGRCATVFDVVAGRVTAWSVHGPAC